jgi:hypothetical protein
MEMIRSSETPVQTRSTWRHIPEDGILFPKVGSGDDDPQITDMLIRHGQQV